MLQPRYQAQDEILVVDDDDLQRELMKAALEELGLNIHEAANGAEALEVFKEHNPMLVVMDIHMPVMDGYAACEAMKSSPGGENAAVMLVTGMEDLASVQKAYDVGAIEFISKPLDWPMFQMRVKYIVRIQQSFLQVQESREKLAWAQRAAGVGSWELNLDKGKLALSDESIALLGLQHGISAFDLKVAYDVIYPKDRRDLLMAYADLRRNNKPMDMDIRLNLGGDRFLTVHVHGEQVLRDRGHRMGISGTLQDVTERKKAEDRIREAAAMKTQFLANMSHELRTPINGVMGMAELLSNTELDEEQSVWTDNIGVSALHLQTVLNDVLDFAKIEAGKVRIQLDPFKLRQSVWATTKLVEALVQSKKLSLKVDVQTDLPDILIGDDGRIRQVLLNLVGNAVKFTEQGGITISIDCVHRENDRCHVRFAVRDTGIGIPVEKQDMIFEQFTQVDGSLTRQHLGTGLGLAISRELIELMDGEVGLQSEEDVGTEIWFVLPLGLSKASVINKPSGSPQNVLIPADAAGMRILLVEDNPINQLFATKVLERLGVSVDVGDNGLQALDMVQKQSYDIVFMDCQMPVLDGYEATRRIRQLGGDFEQMPIVALTAHALEGDREKCLAAGMDDYLTKPVVGDLLVQSIAKWVKMKKPVAIT